MRCGVAALPAGTTALAIFLGDMPDVPANLARTLLDAVKAGAPAAIANWRGIPAHPVAISAAHFPMLQALRGDRGARAAILSLPGVRTIETSRAGATFDIDFPSDVEAQDLR